MEILKKGREILAELKGIDSDTKKQLGLVSCVLFFIFFSYPIARSTVDATFIDVNGAAKSPHVWVYSVIFVGVVVSLYNYLHRFFKVQTMFFATATLTALTMLGSLLLVKNGYGVFSYWLYVLKEAYIVLLFHTTLSWINNAIDFKLAKLLYGPIGAVNSLSGIIGGYLTSALTYMLSVDQIMMIGLAAIFLAGIFFLRLSDVGGIKSTKEDVKESPLKSIASVKTYIILIGCVILLTQFCINMANYKFFILLEQFVTDKLSKTRYLGNIYSSINVISLALQILVLPLALKIFSNRTLHFFIPTFYLFVTFFGFFMGGGLLLPVASAFVVFKGFDYSLFSTAKELLYFPLTSKQKYGAKYLIDMVVYRFGKGVISLLLGFAIIKANIDILLVVFLLIWIVAIIPLFKEMKKITQRNIEKETL